MIGKVKKWLGIEGVKLELVLPEEVESSEKRINGSIRLMSMNPQTVTGIKIVLIEKYSRGRGKEKLIDEYELGQTYIDNTYEVPAEEVVEFDFELPFSLLKSNMEEFGKRNFLFGGIAGMAMKLQGVKSEYRIEAEAEVKGVALNPFDRKPVNIKR
ncbi:MAG: sporulation protein [Phaeodactylibacter sp.]|nr:sporulation protein [Phaeodactylibacter sp.]MCB9274360.1 sporulation protein [Lewinellaceae bacterium]